MSLFAKAVSGVASFVFGDAAGAATSKYLLSDDTIGGRLLTNIGTSFIGSAVDSATGKSQGYEPYVPMQKQTSISGRSGVSAGSYKSSKVNADKIGQVDRVRQKARVAQQSNLPKIQAHVEYISPRSSAGRRTQQLESSGIKLRT